MHTKSLNLDSVTRQWFPLVPNFPSPFWGGLVGQLLHRPLLQAAFPGLSVFSLILPSPQPECSSTNWPGQGGTLPRAEFMYCPPPQNLMPRKPSYVASL